MGGGVQHGTAGYIIQAGIVHVFFFLYFDSVSLM